jgi:predicted transcriptional regulator
MKVLRVGIASYTEMKARTLAIARGQYKPAANEPKIWFTSTESFARILSEKNRALLRLIAESSPQSLTELAQRTGRKKSNLSRTLRTMEQFGFVVLRKGIRGSVVPRVRYQAVSLSMPLGASNQTNDAA